MCGRYTHLFVLSPGILPAPYLMHNLCRFGLILYSVTVPLSSFAATTTLDIGAAPHDFATVSCLRLL